MQTSSTRSSLNSSRASKSVENPVDQFCPKFERMRLQSSPTTYNSPKSFFQEPQHEAPNYPYRQTNRDQFREPNSRKQFSIHSQFVPRSDKSYDRPRENENFNNSYSRNNRPRENDNFNNSYSHNYHNQTRPTTGTYRAAANSGQYPPAQRESDRVDMGGALASTRGAGLRPSPPKILALGDSFIGPLTLFANDVRFINIITTHM